MSYLWRARDCKHLERQILRRDPCWRCGYGNRPGRVSRDPPL